LQLFNERRAGREKVSKTIAINCSEFAKNVPNFKAKLLFKPPQTASMAHQNLKKKSRRDFRLEKQGDTSPALSSDTSASGALHALVYPNFLPGLLQKEAGVP